MSSIRSIVECKFDIQCIFDSIRYSLHIYAEALQFVTYFTTLEIIVLVSGWSMFEYAYEKGISHIGTTVNVNCNLHILLVTKPPVKHILFADEEC